MLPNYNFYDTFKDTPPSRHHLEDCLGTQAAALVVLMTEDTGQPRAERKQWGGDTLETLPRWAKVIKLADVLDNLYSLESAVMAKPRVMKQLAHSKARVD